jgi:hypothetical protein
VKSAHVGYDGIRKVNRDVMRYEGAVLDAIRRTEEALTRMRMAYLLMHGGHIEKGLLARSGISEKLDPARVLELCVADLPGDLPERALS